MKKILITAILLIATQNNQVQNQYEDQAAPDLQQQSNFHPLSLAFMLNHNNN